MTTPVIYFDLGNTLKFNTSGGGEQAYPDAAATLQTLWSRGYRIGLLSNQANGATVAQVRVRLVALGLSDLIDTITISTEIPGNVGKPNQPIFDLALSKAGHAAASSDTVFITETPGHIAAARNLGWRAILKRNSGTCTVSDGDCVEGLAPLTLLFPALPSDLWIRDTATHTGADLYTGSGWWSSPDLWIRNLDDGGQTHQNPEFGQHNWFHARVRNRGNSMVRSFSVGFIVKEYLGTQFVYPQDWFPSMSTAQGGQLEPGQTTTVKARWDSVDVLPAGTHGCWLAVVMENNDPTTAGSHVWEHNNLAQKNLAIVDAIPGDAVDVAITLGNRNVFSQHHRLIEVVRARRWSETQVSLLHPQMAGLLVPGLAAMEVGAPGARTWPGVRITQPTRLEVESLLGIHILAAAGTRIGPPERLAEVVRPRPEAAAARLRGRAELVFAAGRISAAGLRLPARSEERFGVRIRVPKSSKAGERISIHVIERSAKGSVMGGVAIDINVR